MTPTVFAIPEHTYEVEVVNAGCSTPAKLRAALERIAGERK